MLKNKQGFSLITIIIAVLVMIIILSSLTYTAYNSVRVRNLNRLFNDIRSLNDEVAVYYLENNSLPVLGNEIVVTEGETPEGVVSCVFNDDTFYSQSSLINPNDYEIGSDGKGYATYYYLNTDEFDSLVLNYSGNYIINEQSHTIYYIDGVSVGDETFYTLGLDYKDIDINSKDAIGYIYVKDLYLPKGESISLKDAFEFYVDEEKTAKTSAKSITYNSLNGYASDIDYGSYLEYDQKNGILTCIADDISNLSNDESKFLVSVTIQSYGLNKAPVTESINIYLVDFDVTDSLSDEILDSVIVQSGSSVDFKINSYAYCTSDINEFEINSVESSVLSDISKYITKYNSDGTNIITFDASSEIAPGKYKFRVSYKNAYKDIDVYILDVYAQTVSTVKNGDTYQDVEEKITSMGLEFNDLAEVKYLYLVIEGLDGTDLMGTEEVSWNVSMSSIVNVSESRLDENESGSLKLIVSPITNGNTVINFDVTVGGKTFKTVSVPIIVSTTSTLNASTGIEISSVNKYSDLTLGESVTNLNRNNTYKLNIVINDINYDLINYSSSDESLATIDSNGVITTNDKTGSVTFTVTLNIGTKTYSDSVTIKVE